MPRNIIKYAIFVLIAVLILIALLSPDFFGIILVNNLNKNPIKEVNGVIITDDMLFEKIEPESEELVENNIESILAFAKSSKKKVAVTLIPTSIVIEQQKLPGSLLYNQRSMIDKAYEELKRNALTVDVYSNLFQARDEYTYFRTGDGLTGLGGYYVYSKVSEKLGLDARKINQFEIENISDEYYGNLARLVGTKDIKPDNLTSYNFILEDREYKIVNILDGEGTQFYSPNLSYLSKIDLEENVNFGGFGDLIDITSIGGQDDKLLIISDSTILSYLSFLLPDYQRITVINPLRINDEQLAKIDINSYDRVLVNFSVKTLLKNEISMPIFIDEENDNK